MAYDQNVGVVGKQGVNAAGIVIDMEDTIHTLYPNANPFIVFAEKMGKEQADSFKTEWLEDGVLSLWDTTTAYGGAWAAGAASTGTIAVTHQEYFAVNHVVTIPGTSDTPILVTVKAAATGAGNLTGKTVDGSNIDLSAAVAGVDKIAIVGNAFEEGTGKGTIITTKTAEKYNLVQIIKTPFGTTTTLEHTKQYGKTSELAYQQKLKGIEHSRLKERNIFWGVRALDTSGTEDRRYMGGLNEFITTYRQSEADLTESEFNTWVEDYVFAEGQQDNMILFCAPIFFRGLADWNAAKLQITQNEKTHGVAVMSHVTSEGKLLNLISHKEIFDKAPYNQKAFAVDFDHVRYVYQEGLDDKLHTEIQQPDLEQRIDEYRTHLSMKVYLESAMAVLEDVTSISS
jgi:hypothetical protein